MKDGFYCVDFDDPGFYDTCASENNRKCDRCTNCHRKHETPEQFKERTGREWPDDGAVYYRAHGSVIKGFVVRTYKEAKSLTYDKSDIICANTDFGPPPDDFEEGK